VDLWMEVTEINGNHEQNPEQIAEHGLDGAPSLRPLRPRSPVSDRAAGIVVVVRPPAPNPVLWTAILAELLFALPVINDPESEDVAGVTDAVGSVDDLLRQPLLNRDPKLVARGR